MNPSAAGLADTAALGAAIAPMLRPGDAVLFSGPLGAGKSFLARAILRAALGDPALDVPSPSYTLIQSYDSAIGMLHHLDLWRLDGPGGLIELGWDELLADIVLVEWPDRLAERTPAAALRIELQLVDDSTRLIRLEGWPDRLTRLQAAWAAGNIEK